MDVDCPPLGSLEALLRDSSRENAAVLETVAVRCLILADDSYFLSRWLQAKTLSEYHVYILLIVDVFAILRLSEQFDNTYAGKNPMTPETPPAEQPRRPLTFRNSKIIYYGPHPCRNCGDLICKMGHEFGGNAFTYPNGPIYPNTEWHPHVCDPNLVSEYNQPATEPPPSPMYRQRKEIWAFCIAKIDIAAPGDNPGIGAFITPADHGYPRFPVSTEYIRKHNPRVDGYFIQEIGNGGNLSWLPAKDFESNWKRAG